MDATARANAIVRATRSLSDVVLRVAYLLDFFRATGTEEVAAALEVICARAEQAEEAAREVLVAIVDALNASESEALLQRLREEAVGAGLLALERLVRHPIGEPRGSLLPSDPDEDKIP